MTDNTACVSRVILLQVSQVCEADLSPLLDGPLNTQGTYKIHDWTTFARVIKNVSCIPSTGNTTANLKLSKTW